MKNKILQWGILILILLGAGGIYFYNIKNIPNGIYVDETAIGYNAYSIGKTLKDEYGKFLPVAFRFFGAYTPPLDVYLIAPLVAIFGLRAEVLRVTSGVITLAGILVVYWLARGIKIYRSKVSPIIAAGIFAFLPWVVFNARLGYETTLGYMLFAAGVLLVWLGLDKKQISLLGLLLLSLSTYAAHTERYLVPLFLLIVAIGFYEKRLVQKNKKTLMLAGAMLFITQLPNLYLLTTEAFWVKNTAIGDVGVMRMVNDLAAQFLTYNSPRELFGISSDINLQHTIPALAQFYPWMILPFLIGLFLLYKQRDNKGARYLWIMYLTATIPGSLSGHFISIQRVLTLIVPMILIITLGIEWWILRVNKIISYEVLAGLMIFSLTLLWRSYFIYLPQERAEWWNYGYEQLAQETVKNPNLHYVVDNSRASAIYSLFLFHFQYPPDQFQKNFNDEFIKNYYTNPAYNGNYKIGNVEVRPIVWDRDIFVEQILVGDEMLMSPEQAKEHFLEKVIDIKDPLGKSLLLGYKTNPEKKIEDNKRKLRLKGISR